MTAQLLINQTGISAGVVNQARSDGLSSALVTLSSIGPGNQHNFELLWVPEDDTTAIATFQKISATTATFTTGTAFGGTYRIKLTVVQDTGVVEVIRCFSVLTTNGLRIPALNEQASELATLSNGSLFINNSEFNEPSTGVYVSGNYGGWHKSIADLFRLTATRSGGKLVTYGTAAPVSGAHQVGDIVYNTTPISGGFIGFVCVTAGSPGTWKTWGVIS